MKAIKKIRNLILIAMVIIFPFLNTKAAGEIKIPISVEWFYEGQKWASSPHFANVVIEPQDGAPAPSVSSFNYPGDYKIEFTAPEFSKPGKYKYLIYQNNKDFEEKGRSVTYGKNKYIVMFFVQNGTDGLSTSVYSFDADKVDENDKNAKETEIKFENDDPHIHKNNGDIVDPKDPYHPFHPQNPWYPYDPMDPKNPYHPTEPNRPIDPTNPNRNEENTPIYPTEPEDKTNPNKPINPIDPPVPGRNEDYWPESPNPKPTDPNNPSKPGDSENENGGWPWWWPEWPWNPVEPNEPTNPITPSNPPKVNEGEKPWWWDKINPDKDYKPENPPIDPTDPQNPTKPVDTTRPEQPWWWDIYYPEKTFDPDKPDKPVEKPPAEKPWWWDKLFPEVPYNPEDPYHPNGKNPSKTEDDSTSPDKGNKEDESIPTPGKEGGENNTGDGQNKDHENDDASRKNRKDNESDLSESTVKSPFSNIQDDKQNQGIFGWGRNGSDRSSTGRVKTGIESVGMWLIILLIAAYALYKLEKQKRKNPHKD
ncbi:hypothetical protein [uncultured Anaerococcus sp.]|uniref:hypothetical protein n=1 Tax=uncultured Anaerococcus sp. TaxID=293428 RepID=UPI0025D5EE61|nr:hypothetical protein [uncultured Anaerococcus sp.]